MSLALVHSRARAGVSAPPVRVEVHLSGGLPSTQIVGLPEAAVREARDRVRAAILCAQFEFPTRRITVNLAPADLPKDGGRFDLPIALGILAASGQIRREALADYEFLGELSLTGELRAVDGVLPAALAVAACGRTLIVPEPSGAEAALVKEGRAFTGRTLLEVCALLEGRKTLPSAVAPPALPPTIPDMTDVRGQAHARRALEVAAAGGHHLLLIGSPGCGKTLLASRLPGLLPEANDTEAMESAAIASVSGRGLDPARWRQRPYRSPITPPVRWRWSAAADRFRSECDQPEVPANARPPSGSRLTAASGRSGTRPGPRTYPGTLPARPMAQRHPFASRLVRDARGLATVPYKPERSRAQLATDQDSCVAFSNAKSGPCWMQIRVVGEADPLRQALSAKSDAAGVSQ